MGNYKAYNFIFQYITDLNTVTTKFVKMTRHIIHEGYFCKSLSLAMCNNICNIVGIHNSFEYEEQLLYISFLILIKCSNFQ